MKNMKKLNQQGIGHHLVLVIIGVVVLGVVGFAGWRVYQYQGRSIDASAESWRQIRYYGNVGRFGGLNENHKPFVYTAMTAPSRGTYRVCANVSATTSFAPKVYVQSTRSQSADTSVDFREKNICTNPVTLNSGESIRVALYSTNFQARVSSASIQQYDSRYGVVVPTRPSNQPPNVK